MAHDPQEALVITRGELEDLVAHSDPAMRSSLANAITHRHSAERFDSYPWGPNEHPFGAPNRTPRGQSIAQFALMLHHKFGFDLAQTITTLAATTNIWDRTIELRGQLIETLIGFKNYMAAHPDTDVNHFDRLDAVQAKIDQLGVEQEVAKRERSL